MTVAWTQRIAMRNAGREQDVPWWVNDKYKLHMFCAEHGYPVPRPFAFWRTPDEMDLGVGPDRFVLKPTVMSSSWGVMLLERLGDGTYFEQLSRRTLTQAQILAEQVRVHDRCKYKSSYRLMVEEWIEGPGPDKRIPLDYKVSVFYDEPRHVLQIDRNPQSIELAFFDGGFNVLTLPGSVELDPSRSLGQPVRPSEAEEMLQVATRLTTQLRTPFMRVDMFVGPRGPVIGELTASPGGAFYGNSHKYSDAYDEELGQAWAAAEERIHRDGRAQEEDC
ncbi:ATP-grasp fold amidoligase family protein [Knoellia subterranea]|uniref:ATP-grasp domain-containing protein n=1 Tax=Knoellia subterranea KCTC 19937 TaxID=1385521 RepID=A0A0A0JE73_9MICO|nr:ATP-grasp fold amidoligase family protein [Knoellia subterranea]KGN35695.1 hypothetical protein N803_06390 [Knoellia subterranea KCTC 19937]